MPKAKNVIVAIAAVLLASAAFYFLFGVSMKDKKLSGTIDACMGAKNQYKPAQYYKGIPLGPLEPTLCILTSFFVNSMESFAGKAFVFYFINTLFAPVALFMAIESSRKGARFFVAWFGVTILLVQMCGFAIIFPLLFITSFFLNYNQPGSGLVGSKLYWIFLSVLGLQAFLFFLPNTKASWYPQYQFVWNLGLSALVVVWPLDMITKSILPAYPVNSIPIIGDLRKFSPGTAMAVFSYFYFGVISAVYHFHFVYQCFTHWKEIIGYLTSVIKTPASNGLLFFFLADFTFLSAALGLLILGDKGVVAFVSFVFQMFIVGPGTAFMHFCSHREMDAEKLLKSSSPSKKKTK